MNVKKKYLVARGHIGIDPPITMLLRPWDHTTRGDLFFYLSSQTEKS